MITNHNVEGLIQVKILGNRFGSIACSSGMDADICKGDVVFVVGPSGSGKSTFLRCLNLLEEPTEGQIIFEGVDITDRSGTSTSTVRRWGWCSSSSTCSPT